MPDHCFWLSDAQFARLQPLLPNKVRGVPRVDDRKVISGIIHVIRYGLMWRHAPACYGPHKTLYNRFVRWSKAGVFNHIFQTLASDTTATGTLMIVPPISRRIAPLPACSKRGFSTPYRTYPRRAQFQAPRRLRRRRQAPDATIGRGSSQRLPGG